MGMVELGIPYGVHSDAFFGSSLTLYRPRDIFVPELETAISALPARRPKSTKVTPVTRNIVCMHRKGSGAFFETFRS